MAEPAGIAARRRPRFREEGAGAEASAPLASAGDDKDDDDDDEEEEEEEGVVFGLKGPSLDMVFHEHVRGSGATPLPFETCRGRDASRDLRRNGGGIKGGSGVRTGVSQAL